MGTLSKIGDPLRGADCRSCLEGAARLRVFRYRLAGVLQSQGQLEQAEAEYRAVLATETERLGVDHPDTMVTRFELAGVLQQRGDCDAALAEYRELLTDRQRVLGPDYPDTLATRYSVAYYTAMGEAGDQRPVDCNGAPAGQPRRGLIRTC